MKGRVLLDFLLYVAVTGSAWLIRCLPHRVALAVGCRLGDAAWRLSPSRRAITLENIGGAFNGTITSEEVYRLARAVYRNIGRSVAEFCRFPQLTPDVIARLVEIEGREHLEWAYAQGRGFLILSAHLGNWELAGQAVVSLGYPLWGVYRPLSNRFVGNLVNSYRTLQGAKLIAERGSVRTVLKTLWRGEGVTVLLDQNAAPTEGVFVEFLGRPACVYKSLALVASASGAPVIPLFLVRQPDGRHRLIIEPAVPLARTGDPDRDVVLNTERFTRVIEAYVQKYPEQWLWVHRRWATQPPPGSPHVASAD